MTYDSAGRNLTMHDPDTGNWSYSYDTARNLTSQVDTFGQPHTFTYDKLNRLLSIGLLRSSEPRHLE